ncbi:MAG: restriction endonuclease subunit S [Prevotellaceae bacterium]|jgi:type I restriction enzyme S subunit|nr:restriction endonuclease subunit S [Prevotellaceae bacterium]
MKSKKVKNTIVPKLRFPEFRDAKGWGMINLSELGKTFGGLTGKTSDDFGSGQPYVTYKQIFNSSRVDLTKCEFVTIANNEKQNTLEYGDILFTMSSETPEEIGFSSVLLECFKSPLYLNSFCFSFRPNNLDELRPAFSQYLFHSTIYRKSICILAQGITRFNISKTILLNLNLPIPPNPKEQQKIADCLSSLDELICVQILKLEALKIHKKGLMQQLFPDEGKTIPKLRFPKFRDAGEWIQYQLGNLFSERQETGFINLPLLSLTEKEGIIPQEETKRKDNSNSDKSKYLRVYHGDIAYNTMRMWEGRSAFVDMEGLVSPAYTVCKPNANTDSLFFSYYFKTQPLIRQFHKYSQGLVSDTLSLKFLSFSTILIQTPLKHEQQKIADVLSIIDELISVQSRKLETLKIHKKGLMQQLFPNLNTITE